MKTYLEWKKAVLLERIYGSLENLGYNVRNPKIYINPTFDEVNEVFRLSKTKTSARGLLEGDGTVWLWDEEAGEHNDVIDHLGLDAYECQNIYFQRNTNGNISISPANAMKFPNIQKALGTTMPNKIPLSKPVAKNRNMV